MLAIFGALVAGILTTLAPCVLPLLPVIVGGSVAGVGPAGVDEGRELSSQGNLLMAQRAQAAASRRRAYVIAASLGVSVIIFTLILKATTALIGIPPEVWEWVAGTVLILLGLVSLFPRLWEKTSEVLRLQSRTATGLGEARKHSGVTGQILTGAALGPVFTSCSPLFGYVIVTVLPADFSYGMVLLLAYVIGLSGTLLLISLLGQRAVRGARWAADPNGWFRRGLGAIFVVVGILIVTGWMKDIETWILINSPIQPWNLDSGFIDG